MSSATQSGIYSGNLIDGLVETVKAAELPPPNAQITCKHCDVPIGQIVDPWGGKHEWTHRLEDGPDHYVPCLCKCWHCVGIDGVVLHSECIDGEVAEPPTTETYLIGCQYEAPESTSGAADGGQKCSRTPVVTILSDELVYCSRHFAERVL